mgnify:CR=1 FL=1
MTKKRKRLNKKEAKALGLTPKKNDKGRNTARYYITESDYNTILESRNNGILKAHEEHGVEHQNSKFLWLKNKNSSIPIQNPFYVEKEEKEFNELIDRLDKRLNSVIKKSVKRCKIKPKKIKSDYLFDLSVYTDTHIGMEVNANGYSLYGGKWDEKELNKRNQTFLENTLTNKKSNKLIIFDLGDLMDGWNGETVRKGHDLPQNMTNEEAFDIALNFKMKQADYLAPHYEDITFININDDNHSGSFGYVVNSSFKKFVEQKYDHIKVINQRKFIDHYKFGNKVFVSTHGKDSKNLQYGFKPLLNAQQVEKIENYLFEHNLIDTNLEIYFIKGDSHQDVFDNTTSQKFRYWNFPAMSPSSNWVQTNFKKGISGFYTFNFEQNSYHIHPYYFKWINHG